MISWQTVSCQNMKLTPSNCKKTSSSWNLQLHICFPSLISVMYVTTHRCADVLIYRLSPWPWTGILVMPRHETNLFTVLQRDRTPLSYNWDRTRNRRRRRKSLRITSVISTAPHRLQTVLVIVMINTRYRSRGDVLVKVLACGAIDRCSIPGLAATISEISYLLLQVAIWLKDR